MTPNLCAYADPDVGDGPHAIQLHITAEDRARWRAADERMIGDHPGQHDVGTWVSVTDRITGDVYEIRSYPCSLGCRCAAQARTLGVRA